MDSPSLEAHTVRHSVPAHTSAPAAVAIPSGYVSLASIIKARRRGMVNKTPIKPPTPAILATSR